MIVSYQNKLEMNTVILIIILLVKNLLILIILLCLKKETNPKTPKFKVSDRVRITKYKNIFSKGYITNQSKEIFVIVSVLKNNPRIYKIKYLNEEQAAFMKK